MPSSMHCAMAQLCGDQCADRAELQNQRTRNGRGDRKRGAPRIDVEIQGTDAISEVAIVRDGGVFHMLNPGTEHVKLAHVDTTFRGSSYYYLRVTQVDKDEHGNLSRAWSSPIWVKSRVAGHSSPSGIGHQQK